MLKWFATILKTSDNNDIDNIDRFCRLVEAANIDPETVEDSVLIWRSSGSCAQQLHVQIDHLYIILDHPRSQAQRPFIISHNNNNNKFCMLPSVIQWWLFNHMEQCFILHAFIRAFNLTLVHRILLLCIFKVWKRNSVVSINIARSIFLFFYSRFFLKSVSRNSFPCDKSDIK